jgi:hypothetical protein
VSDGTVGVVFDGIVGVVFDGVVGVVFNCVMGVYVHLGVCDFFIGVAFGSLFDILTRVPFSNSNVFMAFGYEHKMVIKFMVLVLLLWIEGNVWCKL